jgi:hypothetical protein
MKRQKGAALLILAAIVVAAGTWLMVTRLGAQASIVPRQRDYNARVLNEAKQALIGYVAMRAGQTGEQDPGALPCPEPAGAYTSAAKDDDGVAAANCSAPAIGRLPWRTLGIDELKDASGANLWYAISPGWHKPSSLTNTVINSNTPGQLTVDGIANSAVALIIAPGPPMVSEAATGCAAAQQVRTAAAINAADYVECDNATPADASFVTTGPSRSFNDQVLMVTARDVLPGIEAAISKRIEREIVPALKTVYASNTWGTNVSVANPIYPFAAPFADPAATTSFQGSSASCASNVCQGLFPVVSNNVPGSTSVCTASAGSPCDPTFVRWTAGTVQGTAGLTLTSNPTTCTVANVSPATTHATRLDCVMRVWSLLGLNGTIDFRIQGTASNVGMALRQFDSAAVTLSSGALIAPSPSVAMNADGTATVTINGRATVGPAAGGLGSIVSNLLCGLPLLSLLFNCREVTVSVPFTMFPDHSVLDARTSSSTGWFMRNEWYRVLYYAAAQGVTPTALPAGANCTPASTNCLVLDAANDKRALFLLAGRSLNGTAGNTRTLADFLDSTVNRDGDRAFETKPVNSSFNDRAIVVQID